MGMVGCCCFQWLVLVAVVLIMQNAEYTVHGASCTVVYVPCPGFCALGFLDFIYFSGLGSGFRVASSSSVQ